MTASKSTAEFREIFFSNSLLEMPINDLIVKFNSIKLGEIMSDLKIIADRLLSAMESLGYGGAKMRDKPQIVSRSMKTVEDELHMERETLCRSFEGLVDFYRTQMSRSQRPTDRKVIKQAAKQFSLNSDQAAALILGSQACPSKK